MTGQKSNRRSHRSIDTLTPELRRTVEQMLVNNKWPDDFSPNYKGTPRHCDVVSYLKIKGYHISKSAIGRFAFQIQTALAAEHTRRIKSYLLHYITLLTEKAKTYGAELTELYARPSLDDCARERRKDLDSLLEGILKHAEKVWQDVCLLDSTLKQKPKG